MPDRILTDRTTSRSHRNDRRRLTQREVELAITVALINYSHSHRHHHHHRQSFAEIRDPNSRDKFSCKFIPSPIVMRHKHQCLVWLNKLYTIFLVITTTIITIINHHQSSSSSASPTWTGSASLWPAPPSSPVPGRWSFESFRSSRRRTASRTRTPPRTSS